MKEKNPVWQAVKKGWINTNGGQLTKTILLRKATCPVRECGTGNVCKSTWVCVPVYVVDVAAEKGSEKRRAIHFFSSQLTLTCEYINYMHYQKLTKTVLFNVTWKNLRIWEQETSSLFWCWIQATIQENSNRQNRKGTVRVQYQGSKTTKTSGDCVWMTITTNQMMEEERGSQGRLSEVTLTTKENPRLIKPAYYRELRRQWCPKIQKPKPAGHQGQAV